ncbi:MAG TPA: Ig-like domain-containing protein, partial [Candidatus Elarobacter sp.]|nr:Ig-like domain-containing protein [Candidatus Elarobacter sp.]
ATSEGKSGTAQVVVASPPPPQPTPVATVVVSPNTGTLTVGGTLALAAVTRDASGAVLTGRTVTWATSAPQVASVSANGVVTAVAAGSATITATSEGKSGTAAITVQAPPPPTVASVTVSPNTGTLNVGATLSLSATARDASGSIITGQTVAWSSSAPSIASVSASGVVTAVAAGPATITATVGGKSGTSAITVQVPPPTVAKVTVSPAVTSMNTRSTKTFTATAFDANNKPITGLMATWSVSDTTVATVAPSGAMTAVVTSKNKDATVVITAVVQGVTGTAILTVQ